MVWIYLGKEPAEIKIEGVIKNIYPLNVLSDNPSSLGELLKGNLEDFYKINFSPEKLNAKLTGYFREISKFLDKYLNKANNLILDSNRDNYGLAIYINLPYKKKLYQLKIISYPGNFGTECQIETTHFITPQNSFKIKDLYLFFKDLKNILITVLYEDKFVSDGIIKEGEKIKLIISKEELKNPLDLINELPKILESLNKLTNIIAYENLNDYLSKEK